jgi:hypothetical protein
MSANIQTLQAIRVRVLPATSHRSKRMLVMSGPTSAGNRKRYGWDWEMNDHENIVEAAKQFAESMNWEYRFFIAAEIPESVHNPNCYLFTQISKDLTCFASHAGIREIAAFETHAIVRSH